MFTKIIRFFPALQWMEILLVVIVLFTVVGMAGSLKSCVDNKLGLETKESLKEKTYVQEVVIKDLSTANAELVKSVDLKDKSSKIDTKFVSDKFKESNKINIIYDDIKSKKVSDINDVKELSNKEPVTIDNLEKTEKQISTIQINSLWSMYCSDPNNSIQCSNNNIT